MRFFTKKSTFKQYYAMFSNGHYTIICLKNFYFLSKSID